MGSVRYKSGRRRGPAGLSDALGGTVRLKSLLQLLLLGSLWGSSYLYIKVAVEGISPLMVVASRLFFGALLLFAVIRIWQLSLPRDRRMWFHLIVMAVIGNVIPWTLISWGGQHIDSGLAAVLNSTTPFFTILFTVAAFRSERLTIPRSAGVILGFAGVGVLTGADVTQIASASVQGQAAILFSSICYGLAFAYARRYVRGDAIVLAGCQILTAFLIISPFALTLGDPMGAELTLARIGAILALGLLTSGVAYILYYRLISDVGATMASYATYLIPVVGLMLGWLVLGEQIGTRSVVGVALILTGLAIATVLHRERPNPIQVQKSPMDSQTASPEQRTAYARSGRSPDQ
jgi:drug/metabolite transporter (DMT)-like permease